MNNMAIDNVIEAPACAVVHHSALYRELTRQDKFLPPAHHELETAYLAAEMPRWDLDQLVLTVESQEAPLALRLAAGRVLALRGDPRIHPRRIPVMVDVPGGEAAIGIATSDVTEVVRRYEHLGIVPEWIVKETPKHLVPIGSFKLGKYPVTNLEYLAYLADNPDGEVPSSWIFGRYPIELSNHPVFTVSEHAADAYCRWLADLTEVRFRLPTESEWEWAAGASSFEFPWGHHYETDRANVIEEGIFFTTPIGSFPKGSSPCGALDMAGNVEEYTASSYSPYPGGPYVKDDLNPDARQYRVARGGSFSRFSDLCRVTRRHGRYSSDLYAMGFRLAI
ncbi:formylglycine-generating enzyme family protein [Agrobacterium radiobacter]|uniref:formylglycine-generating enzyme family protein n=1 Tax=Agrobacterium radiobacter TaxID=362 RepID=UPI003F84338F